jgi:UrcA family protein
MIRHKSTAIVTAVAGCLFAVAMGTAGAAPPASAPTITVSYADLDLTSPQGVQVLYNRIAAAATEVCPNSDTADLMRHMKSRACQKRAIADAVRHVGNQQLAALQSKYDGQA